MFVKREKFYLRIDKIEKTDTPIRENSLMHYKNYSETFPKVSGSKRNCVFKNPKNIFLSVVSKAKGHFLKS